MKIESELRANEREDAIIEDKAKRKEVVISVQSQKDNAAKEVEKVKEEKKRIRDEINKDITEAMQRKKEEEAIEQRKKEELIRQIRELEKIPIVRTKGYDPTETGGHGLLEELSLAELRERLEFNKRQREIEVNQKREENLKAKEDFAEKLMGESERVQKAREERKRLND